MFNFPRWEGAGGVCILAVQMLVTIRSKNAESLEQTLLLEASDELIDGANFDTGFADRRLFNSESLEASSNIDAEIFRFHLINRLLTSLWREKKIS